MLMYIVALIIFGIFVCCLYYTPVIIKKICRFLDRSALGYCIKISLGIILLGGILYLIHLDNGFQINKERLLCNKVTDTCTYSVANYGNDEYIEQKTFSVFSIKSVGLKKDKIEREARFGGTYYRNKYTIKLSNNYYSYFDYPIVRDDYDEAIETLNRFKAFIHNENETEYLDFKDYYIDELMVFFGLLAVVMAIVIICNDFQKWQKTQQKNQ